MNIRDPQQLLVSVAQILDRLGISYAVTGGMSVVVWGRPRFTADIDVILALTNEEVRKFVEALRVLGEGVYIDEEMIRETCRRGGEFNIIDGISGVKIDFWISKDEVARTQLKRRVAKQIQGESVYFLSPEDLILSKLKWFRKSQSSRHLEDVESIFAISGDQLDMNYLRQWAKQLAVEDLLESQATLRTAECADTSFLYETAVISEQGKRDYMEDYYTILDEQQQKGRLYGGVYDGHGGSSAAEYARDHLHKIFFKAFKKSKDYHHAFRAAYEETVRGIKDPHIGTCALDFLVTQEGLLFFAHAGDSRLIIVDKDGNVRQLTRDHRLEDSKEQERIEGAGGVIRGEYILKGGFGLMPTRSLGDTYFRSVGVIATPDMGRCQVSLNDKWIIAGTDGVFDLLENEEIAHIVKNSESAQEIIKQLKQVVLSKRSADDNLTAIVIRIVCNIIKTTKP